MGIFEEKAIESAPCKPKIWNRYVDDTFTILHRDRVDSFLQHLNSQQPTIRFTKPTHTDQYLAYDSHHPQSVKRGIVKCLYDWTKRLVTKLSVISEEKKHLSSVLVSNGYPSSFVQKITKARTAPRKEWQSSNPPPFYPTYRSIGASSPLPRTTRHSHHLQIRNGT